MKLDTLLKLVKSYDGSTGDDLTAYVKAYIKNSHDVKTKIKDINKQKSYFENKITKILRNLEWKRKQIQEECLHVETVYWPDASGNNDSITQCTICGIEGRRINRKDYKLILDPGGIVKDG